MVTTPACPAIRSGPAPTLGHERRTSCPLASRHPQSPAAASVRNCQQLRMLSSATTAVRRTSTSAASLSETSQECVLFFCRHAERFPEADGVCPREDPGGDRALTGWVPAPRLRISREPNAVCPSIRSSPPRPECRRGEQGGYAARRLENASLGKAPFENARCVRGSAPALRPGAADRASCTPLVPKARWNPDHRRVGCRRAHDRHRAAIPARAIPLVGRDTVRRLRHHSLDPLDILQCPGRPGRSGGKPGPAGLVRGRLGLAVDAADPLRVAGGATPHEDHPRRRAALPVDRRDRLY